MVAKNLQSILFSLCRDGDVHYTTPQEFERRFEGLRGYGRLPRGRENRARSLTEKQIAAAVLGLVPIDPAWAGHGAAILEKLMPVGGTTGAFGDAATLLSALEKIVSDEPLRNRLICVRLSVAESGTNANGSATIIFQGEECRQQTHYVSQMALTLHRPDARPRFDDELRHATFGREVVLNRDFFRKLVRAVQDQRTSQRPLEGDGSEYDAEDVENARRARLEARPSSRFLSVGVDNQVTWPKREELVTFDNYKLVLLPKTKDHVQSAHIDLHAHRLSHEEGLTVINRFLSLLTWCDDQYAIAEDGSSGSPVPNPVRKRDLAFITASHWLFSRSIPISDEAKRALALYREARNAEQNFMISYAVLNYYKIIEIHHQGWKASTKWVEDNLPAILNDRHDQQGIAAFLAACGREKPEMYIYAACRVAVAHVSPNRPSDPDEVNELRRLHTAADVMRRLARRFIITELGVSDSPFSDTLRVPGDKS